ncbi:MAG: IS1595 family transposase [Acidimicrobiia bacterium]|nr:IS1595 family transposase [Acidimicrobiia bacterium]
MAHKAPGKHFRKGLSLVEITRMFPDDATAERWFVETRWADGVHCPDCGSTNVQERPTRKPQPYRCRDCRKDFSVKLGTLMEGSKLGFQVWAIAIFLLATNLKSVSSMKLHRDLGITQKTAWYLAQRIRETWRDNGSPFAGPVEADEAYLGGKRKNMSAKKRKAMKGAGPTAGKAIVVGAKDRESNQVVARVVENTEGPTLKGFVAEHTAPGATVYTDESKSYSGLGGDFDHDTVNHSAGEYVRGMAHTNGIESFWAMLKRGYQGTFHHFSEKHCDRYVNEFAGRHNDRDADTLDIMGHMAKGLEGKRLQYRDLIA